MLLAVVLLAACQSGGDAEEIDDPVALLAESANNIQMTDSFRMEVTHSGADYLVDVYLDEENADTPVSVAFRRAIAEYIAPNILQADARILLRGVAVDLTVFSREDDQWWRLLGDLWVRGQYAPGFNPRELIAEDSGFQAALEALEELNYAGVETLEDGTQVYHLTGIADGADVTAILVGLIEIEGNVPIDVFVDVGTRYPVRLIVRQPETDPENPTTWTIDVYDINEEIALEPPPGALEEES
jgi:hypothetical protein